MAPIKPFVACLFLTTTSLAGTINVPLDHATIQEAVDVASDGDVIIVGPGTYTAPGADQVVDMRGKAVTLKSSDGPAVTIIDGEGVRRGITCVSGETNKTIIKEFTITNGFANEVNFDGNALISGWETSGGGIFCWLSSPSIKACVISGNVADVLGTSAGGGLYIKDASPTIDACTITDNIADTAPGAGCYVMGGATTPRLHDLPQFRRKRPHLPSG